MGKPEQRITNSKPIPRIPLPFKEVMADVLKVKPPEKGAPEGKDEKPLGSSSPQINRSITKYTS